MKGALAVTAISATLGPLALASSRNGPGGDARRFGFAEVEAGVDPNHHVAPGYHADILIRWGDPVLPGAPAFDPMRRPPTAQKQQFGYNNDFVGYFPLDGSSRARPARASTTSTPTRS